MSSAQNRSPLGFSTFQNVIAGNLRGSERIHRGVNPSDRVPLWEVPIASVEDLNEAVKASQNAFKSWSKTAWEERQKCLVLLRDELLKNKLEMCKLVMLEAGKPNQFADLEIEHAAGFLDFQSKQTMPEVTILQDDEQLRLTLRYEPLGVVGAICPWNFPLILAVAKIGAALLTGNCVIVKPSPYTPYSILKFAEMAREILPPGVFQAKGDDKLGPQMTEHAGISKISFTGSTATGKRVMMSAAKTLKSVTLELGGNSAAIICADIDIDMVASHVAMGAFFNSGQFCVASKRLYVHSDIYAQFLQAITNVVKSWKVGPASVEGTMLGPVQNEMQYNIVKSFFEDTAANGYRFALGGLESVTEHGFVIEPAIIDNPPDNSKIVEEEPFGPIVPILVWTTEEEVISRVNDTLTGLGGTVWSADLDRAERLASQIEAGTVWINSFEKPLAQGYLTGYKQSGVGGEWGKQGLLAYMNAKVVHQYKIDPARGAKL